MLVQMLSCMPHTHPVSYPTIHTLQCTYITHAQTTCIPPPHTHIHSPHPHIHSPPPHPHSAQDGYCADPFVTDTGASVRNDICLNSCGTCAAQAASTTYNLSTCADIKAPGVDCPAWASQGLCAPENLWNAVSVANVWCRATCKTCASTKSCLDKSTRCPALAAGGYCQTDFLYAVNSHATAVNVVEELCPNTCGNPRCTEGAAALAKPKYCYDRHPSCADDLIDAEDVEGSCGGSYFDLPVDTYCM